jgi:hypothetical protein
MAETDLYLPVKRFLERQGYVVKAEVRSCDVVGVRGSEPPVIVELKTSFSLQLVYQAMDRLAMTDAVYVAVAQPKHGAASHAVKLCKRIGVGLIVVTGSGSIEVLVDPVPYVPRKNTKRRSLLLREFVARKGDPNVGGSTGVKLMTAYRQDAMLCAEHLRMLGPSRVRDIRQMTKVGRAASILRDNHYGWFVREARGIYGLTEALRAGSRQDVEEQTASSNGTGPGT